MVEAIPFPRSRAATGGPTGTMELSWELFGELCRGLALRVSQGYDPELVIGIATAGVLPGATVAAMLQVDFESMRITRREGGVVHPRPAVLSAAPARARGRRVLVVDEIATSGETFRVALAAVREAGPAEIRTASCFVRPGGFRPDFSALETDQLIVFPWDREVIEAGERVVPPIYSGPVLEE